MSRFFFFILVLVNFCLDVLAQTTPTFDFLAANAALKKANSFRGIVQPNSQCHPIFNDAGDQVLTCQVKAEDFSDSVILSTNYAAGQLPELLNQALPDNFKKDVVNKKVSCFFRFTTSNDNKLLLGCKNDGSQKSVENCGDDRGYTHGLSVGVSCASEDGVSTAFTYSTDLYSNPDYAKYNADLKKKFFTKSQDEVRMKQKFTSENIFALLQDNINQGQVTYWKRGVGLVNITDKKKWGLLQSTGQQQWFHHMMNKVSANSAMDYVYEQGSVDKWGAFVTLSVGLQQDRKLGDRCSVKASVDFGGQASTLSQSSKLNLNFNAKATVDVTDRWSVYMRGQSETTWRPGGNRVTQNTLAAGLENKSGSLLELSLMRQNGRRQDVPDLPNVISGKSDTVLSLQFRQAFNPN